MYYGFIRPTEIGKIRVSMIDLKNNVIVLPPKITKNKKPRHVRISEGLKKIISVMELDSYKKDHYFFGHNLKTGAKPMQKNYASELHR